MYLVSRVPDLTDLRPRVQALRVLRLWCEISAYLGAKAESSDAFRPPEIRPWRLGWRLLLFLGVARLVSVARLPYRACGPF